MRISTISISVVLGGALGVLVSQFATHLTRSKAPSDAFASDAVAAEIARGDRPQRPEPRVSRPIPGWTVDPPPADPSRPGDPNLELAERRQAFQGKLRRHDSETVNPSWAAATSTAIDRGLRLAAGEQNAFSVLAVDCKHHTCIADLEWPSYADAASGYSRAISASLDVFCGTEIVLMPPQGSATYRAKMLLDCRPAEERLNTSL